LSRLLLLVLGALTAVPRSALALDVNALPKGAQVSAGAATVSQSGNRMDVNQASERASLNWASFNIGRDAKVQFNQPSSSSVALNRVAGGASEIQGRLSANGQVFLLNPSGVLFSKTARVNVGGLVASSLNLSDEDFMAGRYRFSGVGQPGSVVNQGELIANRKGYLALLAPQVSNEGVMSATLGTVALGAGKQVTLKFEGSRLLDMVVDQGALNSLAQNKQLIQADGGQVLMTAAAAEQLAGGVVNNVGIVRARSIENRDGKILLLGDMKTGKAEVGGTLDASAPEGGRGGFIDTSAATVQVAGDAKVTTQATPGQANGTWLIDPADFTIAASGGNISGSTLSSSLASGNVILLSSSLSDFPPKPGIIRTSVFRTFCHVPLPPG
jgi:filamentous hemagglutinin family protein